MKKKLFVGIIKTDLKNSMESGMLNAQQQLMAINTALRDLAGIDDDDINKVIEEYREVQSKLENDIEEAQKKIIENANNIYEHLMKEL